MINEKQKEKFSKIFNQNVNIPHSGTGTMFFTYEAKNDNLINQISKFLKKKSSEIQRKIFVELDFDDIMPKQNAKVNYIILFSTILEDLKEFLPKMFKELAKKLKNENLKDPNFNIIKKLEDIFSNFLPLALFISKYVLFDNLSSFENFLSEFRNKENDIYVQNQKLIFSSILKIFKLLDYRLILSIRNLDLLYLNMNTINKKGTARFLKEITISNYYPCLSLSIYANYNFWIEIFSYQEAMARRFFRPINKLIFLDFLSFDQALKLVEKSSFSVLDQIRFRKIISNLTKDHGLKLYQESFSIISKLYGTNNEILSQFEDAFILSFFRSQFYYKQIIIANPDIIHFLILRGYGLLLNNPNDGFFNFINDYLPVYNIKDTMYLIINPNQMIKTVKSKIKNISTRNNRIYFLYDKKLNNSTTKRRYVEEFSSSKFRFKNLKWFSPIIASACYFKEKDLKDLRKFLEIGGFNFE